MPSDQSQIIEQAKFTYSPLSKASEKQTKTIEDQGRKQAVALKLSKPDQQLSNKDEIRKDQLSKEVLKQTW